MKKGKLISALTLGLLLIGAGASAMFNGVDVLNAKVYTNVETNNDIWSLVGSYNNWDVADKTNEFKKIDGKMVLNCKLTNDTHFKAVKNHDWNGALGYDANVFYEGCFNHDNDWNVVYTGNADDNLKLVINNGKWETATINPHTLTVKYGDSILYTKDTSDGYPIKENYVYKEDMFYDGLFTDKELTKEFNMNTKVTADLTLYAKYTPIGNKKDQTVFVENTGVNKLYGWHDGGMETTGTWDNCINAQTSKKGGINYFVIPVELRINKFVLRTNDKQSEDVSLNQEGICSANDEVFYLTCNFNNGDKFKGDMVKDTTIALNTIVSQFRAVRNTSGYVEKETETQTGICGVTKDSDLMKTYNGLSKEVKPLLKDIADHGKYSVYDTMEYLVTRLNEGAKATAANVESDQLTMIIALSIITLLVIAASALIINKRRQLN